MVRNGQIPKQTQAPRHNEGGTSSGEGGNSDSNQDKDPQARLGDEVETESLRIETQHNRQPPQPILKNEFSVFATYFELIKKIKGKRKNYQLSQLN